METIGGALGYIEEHLTDRMTPDDVARAVSVSPFYFQKCFAMLCGCSVGEYIRKRRLSLAGGELVSGDEKVIDIALKYGYDSPDSFTKAFVRFHGVTPSAVRSEEATLRSFAPLKIKFTLEGGYPMEYKIESKAGFTLLGKSKTFGYERAKSEIPEFWREHYKTGGGKYVFGMYGVSIDANMTGETFEYLIADAYNPAAEIPEGYKTLDIPAFTWAVFPCRGAMPDSMQSVNEKIFSEWLPSCRDYEIAAGYCVEMYEDPAKYKNGTADEKYYSEIWIPVKKK